MGVKKKTKEKKKPETTDIDKLFSGKMVEGYEIRSFSLGDIVDLTPWFQKVAIKFTNKEIDINNLSSDKIQGLLGGLEVLPEVPEFLHIYLKEDIETILKFDLDKSQKIIFSIFVKNFEYLKNSFRLVTGMLRNLNKKTT